MVAMGPGESFCLCAKTQKMWGRVTESGRSCEAPGLAEMCCVKPRPSCSSPPSDLSGPLPSRFYKSADGGRLDAALYVATHRLRLPGKASCLYLDGVRKVRALLLPLTHIHIYWWLC